VKTEKPPAPLKIPNLTTIGALMGNIGSHEEFLAASPQLLKAIENTERISADQSGAQVSKAKNIAGGPTKLLSTDKRSITLLRGIDGKLKDAVPIDLARRYGGVSRRAIEKAIKRGTLQARGERLNRVVSVESLLVYFPPETNTN
jgi:hypothetical protein